MNDKFLTAIQRNHLATGASELGVALSDQQIDQLDLFASFLYQWNERMNLTRVASADVVPLHFLDSLSAHCAVDLSGGGKLLDIGTGAGFPGIPLKIAFPELDLTLLDSTRKRLVFLASLIQELGLKGIETVHARAEDAGRKPDYREKFDFAVARAVAPMNRLAGWLLPFVRARGFAVALKSDSAELEIQAASAAIRLAGGGPPRTVSVRIPGTEIDRQIAVIRKIKVRATNTKRRPPTSR